MVAPRPQLLEAASKRLSRKERFILSVVESSFRPGFYDRTMRFFQRTVGQAWIHHCTKYLREIHGLERLPALDADESIIVVANHRSFFDLYVVTADLVRRGMKKRIVFPVRSSFFYERLLGLFVNFVMSFLAMYPPLFRERKRAALNLHSLDELGSLINRGNVFCGLHPEGTRSRDDNPYTFLPAQPGVGRVIHRARVKVVPAFVSGLSNDLKKQVGGNWNGQGDRVIVVFGDCVDFGDLLDQKSSPKLFRAISERCLEAIGELGQQEKTIRETTSAAPIVARR